MLGVGSIPERPPPPYVNKFFSKNVSNFFSKFFF
jgi:hypothetical protein